MFLAKSKAGGENEHIAFLSSKALELQGEVKKAFLHAVIYQSLDPLVFIKNATFLFKITSLRHDKKTARWLQCVCWGCPWRCVSLLLVRTFNFARKGVSFQRNCGATSVRVIQDT